MPLSLLEAVVLGLVQGIAEWLPVSSSGHLVLVQSAMELEGMVLYDSLLHLVTAAAAALILRRDVADIVRGFLGSLRSAPGGRGLASVLRGDPRARLAWLVVIGTLPAAAAGFLLSDPIEALFEDVRAVAVALIITGAVLLTTLRARPGGRDPNARDALIVGAAQAVALAPGISRSGMTVAAGLHAGLDRDAAARYSILLSIPAIVGAAAFQLAKAAQSGELGASIGSAEAAGLAVAAGASLLCVRLLLDIVGKGWVHLFAAYCVGLGAAVLAYVSFWA